jgi:tRNA threonylcarbamoyladenosine biosynthesis protein TsaB
LNTIRETTDFRSHTERITLFIEECVEEAGLIMKDLNAVCISSGPGSYTGLRIGASIAKGLCFALDIPLISINSLACLLEALPEKPEGKQIGLASIDARRQEIYAMIQEKKSRSETLSIILDHDNILNHKYHDNLLLLVGNGSEKCQDLLTHETQIITRQASSRYMVEVAFNKYRVQNFNDIITFSPYYHKKPNITLSKKRPF